ncbi:MAG: hypothetical protein ACMXYC_02295 [Candidatus Woesearchaeota archaeon]
MYNVQYILLGLVIYFIMRYALIKYAQYIVRKRKLEQEYYNVITMPQYKVKGQFDD